MRTSNCVTSLIFFEKYHLLYEIIPPFKIKKKKFSIIVLFLPKILKKTKEKWTKISFLKILSEKYKHFRRHLGCSCHFDF
jgi:hypothetical protein